MPIKVLVAKAGLDAHERGAQVVTMGLKDAGMEVIYAGLRQTPEQIIEVALQEDVNVLGISSMAGAHNAFVAKLIKVAKEKNFDLKNVVFMVGGIIPDMDYPVLQEMGVSGIFGPGTPIPEIVKFIQEKVV
jgi:methylmalonyl-CoA mutase C-terminal domain/subunit